MDRFAEGDWRRGAEGIPAPGATAPDVSTRGRSPILFLVCLIFLASGLGTSPDPLVAQEIPAAFGTAGPDPDFLFSQPRVSLGIRGGMFFHRADSDLFDFTEERFTLDRSEFRGPAFGIEAGFWLGARGELTLGLEGSRASVASEYRDWVEDDGTPDGLPIRQTTRISEGPSLSAGARYYLRDRGQQFGRFAWVPASWNVFAGVGGALTRYELELSGDFVDEVDDTISGETFASSGGVFQPFVSTGAEIRLSTRTSFLVEGRYLWGSDELGPDFASDFTDPLDLAGMRVTLGLQLRAF